MAAIGTVTPAAPPSLPSTPIASDWDAATAGHGGLYSIRDHFDSSCSVLLTGATGYIGSLVLEKLLRSTSVGRVYVLVRARRGFKPADRLARVLSGPLFHLITEEQAARVTAVAGDILQQGLGLSPEDEAMLVANVDTVVHSAADIRLDAPIHDTLKANYLGSLSVASLSARMPRLRSLTYVSTCYTNINRPRGSLVEERLYPLTVAGKEVDVTGLAEELLSLPSDEAGDRAQRYIGLWGFRNTYALGKHLAEKALAGAQRELGLPLAIVRPSLVSAIAAEPYAGYSGNFAGPVGGAAAYLTGLYDDQPEAVASDGSSIWDIVPGDVAAHGIIATAAAVASPSARAMVVAAAAGAQADDAAGAAAAAAGTAGAKSGAAPIMVVQIATSCTYPLTTSKMFNDGVLWCAAHRRPFTLAVGRSRGMAPDQRYDDKECSRLKRTAATKVGPLVWLLKNLGGRGGKKMASLLSVGMRTFETINTKKYDLQLFFGAAALLRLEASLAPDEREDFFIVWRPPPAERNQQLAPEGASAAAAAVAAAAAAAWASCPRWDSDSDTCTSTDASGATPPGAGGGAAARRGRPAGVDGNSSGAVTPATSSEGSLEAPTNSTSLSEALRRAQEGGWTLFNSNALAFLYKSLYGREVPCSRKVGRRRVSKLLPHVPSDQLDHVRQVQHSFCSIRR